MSGQTIDELANDETAVPITSDRASVMCVQTHPNIIRRKAALVSKGVGKVMPHGPFSFPVTNFTEKKTHVLKGTLVT